MKSHCIRLKPNMDLKKEILNLCLQQNIKAGCIISAVGSLKQINLRLASFQNNTTDSNSVDESASNFLIKNENFEIVSITGTVSQEACHIHLAVADSNAQVFGGHLMFENLIYTTCELIILEIPQIQFLRTLDPQTQFKELIII